MIATYDIHRYKCQCGDSWTVPIHLWHPEQSKQITVLCRCEKCGTQVVECEVVPEQDTTNADWTDKINIDF